jgi:hypothetical protein
LGAAACRIDVEIRRETQNGTAINQGGIRTRKAGAKVTDPKLLLIDLDFRQRRANNFVQYLRNEAFATLPSRIVCRRAKLSQTLTFVRIRMGVLRIYMLYQKSGTMYPQAYLIYDHLNIGLDFSHTLYIKESNFHKFYITLLGAPFFGRVVETAGLNAGLRQKKGVNAANSNPLYL